MEDYIKIRVTKELKESLKKEATLLGLTVSSYVRLKLNELIKSNNG